MWFWIRTKPISAVPAIYQRCSINKQIQQIRHHLHILPTLHWERPYRQMHNLDNLLTTPIRNKPGAKILVMPILHQMLKQAITPSQPHTQLDTPTQQIQPLFHTRITPSPKQDMVVRHHSRKISSLRPLYPQRIAIN